MVEYLSGERVQGLGEQSSEVLNTMSNQNSNGKLCTNEQYFYGQQIGTGFSGIGEQINRVDFYMQKDGNPTGNAKCTIYTGSVLSGGSVHSPSGKTLAATSTTTFDISTLHTSNWQTVTFEFSSLHTLAAGDVIGFQLLDSTNVPNDSNAPQIGFDNNDVITNSLICRAPYGETNGDPPEGLQSGAGDRLDVNYPNNYSLIMKLYKEVSAEKDSIINVPSGTRFEETDTRKIYRMTNSARGGPIGTEFNLRFDYEVDSYPAGTGASGNYGIFSKDNTTGANTGGQDFVVLANNDGVKHKLAIGKNTSPYGGSGVSGSSWIDLVVGTQYYVEIVGNDDDTYTLSIRTGSHSGSHVSGSPQTVDASSLDSLANMKYFGFKNTTGGGNGGTVTLTDNLALYNGTTSASGTASFTDDFANDSGWTFTTSAVEITGGKLEVTMNRTNNDSATEVVVSQWIERGVAS